MAQADNDRIGVPGYWLRDLPAGPMTHDAIIVGSGAAGGVAAERLCSLGLNVLVLEAGSAFRPSPPLFTRGLTRALKLLTDRQAERYLPPRMLWMGERAVRFAGRLRQPVQSKLYAWALAPDALVDDLDCPYTTDADAPFHWFRSRQPGGKMVVPGHGRQYYRLGGMDGKPGDDGLPYWPMSASDLAPWYSLVERKLRLRGGHGETGVELTSVIEPSAPEAEIMRRLKARRPEALPRMGSHAAPLPWLDEAHAAGRLTCRGGAVVRRILVDKSGRAEGAEWYDCDAGRLVKASAPIVFLCASAIESTRILMLSAGRPGAEPVGMHSPALGRYLMDHAKVSGGGFARNLPGMADQKTEQGRSIYLPSYGPAGSSFGMQIHVQPRSAEEVRVDIVSFAEILPEADNRIELDPSRLDAFGMPVPNIRLRFSEAQRAAGAQQIAVVRQVIDDLQLNHVTCSSELAAPGTAVHESGTARMGINPESSVVDSNNECWDAKGLYVTDGACFPRVSLQNPTLAIMALTARAAEHAAASVRKAPSAGTQSIRQSFAQPSASSAQDIVAQG